MALIITLNVILAVCVLAMVLAPLVWAILTQHRDARDIRLYDRRRLQRASKATPARSPQYDPVA